MATSYSPIKIGLMVLSLVVATIYALPNLYGEDPALQISSHSGQPVSAHIEQKVSETLERVQIPVKSIESVDNDLLVRLKDHNQQITAQDAVSATLGNELTVALNLAPATPKWLEWFGAKPMKLGLDLRGGVHFLIEVDVASAVDRRIETTVTDIRNELRRQNIRYIGIKQVESTDKKPQIRLRFRSEQNRAQAMEALQGLIAELDTKREDRETSFDAVLQLLPNAQQSLQNYVVEQTITTLRNRVNELGVAEAIVQRQGQNHVVVELPGIQDTARAKDILGKTATLEFLMAHETQDPSLWRQNQTPIGTKLYKDKFDRPVLLKKRVILSGESVTGAMVGSDPRDGRPAVKVRVGGSGLDLFKKATRENVGKVMAVVYIESRMDSVWESGELVKKNTTMEKVISQAVINEGLGSNFQITGLGMNEAKDLALLLRSGALPATISIVEERTVGPSLGQENIELGLRSVQVGMGLVLVAMLAYYNVFGIIANVGLLLNLVFLVSLLSILGATLTLPGIAGIVLTVGMAVDANVLIFERIREELRLGMSPQMAINSGFDRALSTIIDANITTLIVGLILFFVGTGPVRGFAVTLSIGILTSMLTAVTGTRAMVHLVHGNKKISRLRIGV